MQYAWTCACCGKQFDTLPLDWAYDAPNYWNDIPEAERATRGRLSADFCVADEHFFIRGCLEVPIIDFDDKLVLGVWVSQSAASFKRAQESFDHAPIRTKRRASAGSVTQSASTRHRRSA